MGGRDLRPLIVLAFILVLLLLLKKGGDLTVFAGEDLDTDLGSIPDIFLPAIFIPRIERRQDAIDLMCNCDETLRTPTLAQAIAMWGPNVTFKYASPRA